NACARLSHGHALQTRRSALPATALASAALSSTAARESAAGRTAAGKRRHAHIPADRLDAGCVLVVRNRQLANLASGRVRDLDLRLGDRLLQVELDHRIGRRILAEEIPMSPELVVL